MKNDLIITGWGWKEYAVAAAAALRALKGEAEVVAGGAAGLVLGGIVGAVTGGSGVLSGCMRGILTGTLAGAGIGGICGALVERKPKGGLPLDENWEMAIPCNAIQDGA